MLMPRVKQIKGLNKDCIDVCPKHKDDVLKYYCHFHDAVGCFKCKRDEHRNCKDVDLISDVASSFSKSEEVKELQQTLKELLTCNNNLKNELNRKTKAVIIQADRVKSKVKKLRLEIDEMFDIFVKKINRSIDDMLSIDEANLLAVDTYVEKLSKDLNDNLSKINDFKVKGNMCKLFITAKLAGKSATLIAEDVKSLEKKNYIRRYQFVPDTRVVEMLQNLTEIGRLDMKPASAKVPKFEKDINVRFPCDEKECIITGLEMLSDSIIAVADHTNDSVKVVDIVNNSLKSVYKLNGSGALIKPFDLVKTSELQIAVTYPFRKSIQMLEISDSRKIRLKREIDMKNECFGIDRVSDNLVLTFRKPSSVKILTLTGSVVKTLMGNFTEFPDYVSVSQVQNYVYASNWASPGPGTVIGFTMEGDTTVVFEDENLYGPHGSSVDKHGTVYVCGRFSHNVFQISENCDMIQEILNKDDGLKGPQSITFNRDHDRLYIGMEKNAIKVFQLY